MEFEEITPIKDKKKDLNEIFQNNHVNFSTIKKLKRYREPINNLPKSGKKRQSN
jgi:hypothetical protein